jgi:hypothetical protein
MPSCCGACCCYKQVAVASTCVLPQGLPDKLTLLEFCWQGDETLSSTAAPDLAHMTALQHLRLIGSGAGMRMCPSLLLQMRQLRHLQLSQLVVDMPALLAALRGLQQLQHLDVSLANGTWALEGAAMQQYSAFTALCQLTHLRVAVEPPGPGVEFDTGTPLPVGAVQYIFPAGKQLPRLKQLHLGVSDDKYIGARFGSRWKEESRYMELLGPGDLAVVAAACPALEQFWAIAAVVSNAQLADVARMTSVTQLKIGGHGLGAAALVAAVPQMPQLQDLSVVGVRDLEPKDLPPLTQLTALRQLRLSDCPGLEEMEENGELLFTSKVCVQYGSHLWTLEQLRACQLSAAAFAFVSAVNYWVK